MSRSFLIRLPFASHTRREANPRKLSHRLTHPFDYDREECLANGATLLNETSPASFAFAVERWWRWR